MTVDCILINSLTDILIGSFISILKDSFTNILIGSCISIVIDVILCVACSLIAQALQPYADVGLITRKIPDRFQISKFDDDDDEGDDDDDDNEFQKVI
ncbi:hypothetical protein ANN_17113 [Periplaneta americana]|uniref:Uncharacterized protein n=1 Tax=Periplaneta americana TaxID=6978 RepID=A0ABQ8STB3_PERAM|nr:hypothetical protein ANN_17113 [Periplaneta americana]